MSRRSYDNTARAEQARATRRRVVEAARDLIVARGPGAVTMRDIAAAAQVSPETVYKSFGTKVAVIKAVYDVTLAGDDEPVAMADRPEYQAIAAADDSREKIRRYARLARTISVRLGPLLARLRAAAMGGDDSLAAMMSTVDDERLTGTMVMVGHLAPSGDLRTDMSPEQARDIVWALISPEMYDMLVIRRGWSPEDYEQWLAESLTDALLRRDPRTAESTARCRLATYGTLAPGRPNHHQLDGLEGRWFSGKVHGTLVDAGWGATLGYPALVLDPAGPGVDVQVFESGDLPAHWPRLDAFEGPGYRRVPAVVHTAAGEVEASIYVLAAPSASG